MNEMSPEKSRAMARSTGESWDEILDRDTKEVPQFLREESVQYLGSDALEASRYTSADFFRLENEKMWPRVWQFVAREEEIPDPGDVVVYENVGKSFLVTRQKDGSVRTFYNYCLHRGRKLRTASGYSEQFKCPFHGFTWNVDGSLKEIPCRWDFEHLVEENMTLPEVRTERWAGFIFINEDPDAAGLMEFLDPLPEHFKRWRLEECFTGVWVGKVIPANWKATAEAFMEAWHSYVTHPHILPFTGDSNTRYDIYGDHVNRALTPFGVLSPHLYGQGKSEQWIVDEFLKSNGRAGDETMEVSVPAGSTARAELAQANRVRFAEMSGYDHSDATDAELVDALVYNVFPNMAPWGGFMPNIVYRWRPWPDQDHTLMEVRMLIRAPKGEPMPRAVQMRLLGDEEPWSAASEELSAPLAHVFDQDMANLPYVQEGLKVSPNNRVQLGNYQEIRIRHFHRTLDKYLGRL